MVGLSCQLENMNHKLIADSPLWFFDDIGFRAVLIENGLEWHTRWEKDGKRGDFGAVVRKKYKEYKDG